MRNAVVAITAGLILWPGVCRAQVSGMPDIFRTVEREILAIQASAVDARALDIAKAQAAVEAAKAGSNDESLKEAQRALAESEVMADALERQIRSRIEQGALQRVEKGGQFTEFKAVPLKTSRLTLIAAISTLYKRQFDVQSAVYENYVFIEAGPTLVGNTGTSQALIHLVLYWAKQGGEVLLRYAPLEKRLRSPEPRLTADSTIKALVDKAANELIGTIVPGGK